MADGPSITVEFPELDAIRAAFRGLPKNIAAKYMAAALGKAIEPGLRAVKVLTPRGPTGNLKRAIRKKTKRYTRTGSGVALVGYTAAPRRKASELKSNEKGQHQGFLEFGTKDRRTKGRIASSFTRSGPVKISVAKRSGRIATTPKPPKGFFKAVRKGETVDLGKFPIGGKSGKPPIKTAFEQTRATISAGMNKEMTVALNNALKEMASPFRRSRGR
jgi:hypothetical protein